jgi:hypothetical protein
VVREGVVRRQNGDGDEGAGLDKAAAAVDRRVEIFEEKKALNDIGSWEGGKLSGSDT